MEKNWLAWNAMCRMTLKKPISDNSGENIQAL